MSSHTFMAQSEETLKFKSVTLKANQNTEET